MKQLFDQNKADAQATDIYPIQPDAYLTSMPTQIMRPPGSLGAKLFGTTTAVF